MDRLQKVLARAGVASRRAAEAMIEAGRVTVNGTVVTRLGTRVDRQHDAIKVDGKSLRAEPEPVYLVLHKPRGFITTASDPQGRPTVLDLLRGVSTRVFPVGRLDYASEGLLLLTNDGELARDLMHPGGGVPKTYLAKVEGNPTREALGRLGSGISIEGGRTLPARARLVRPGANAWVEVTVVEGRKHQVRRMLEAIGHPTVRLRRIRYDGLDLGDLPTGAFRPLTQREIDGLKAAVRRRRVGGRAPGPGGPSGGTGKPGGRKGRRPRNSMKKSDLS